MKALNNLKILLIVTLMAFSLKSNAQDFSKITNSLKNGNVQELVTYFDNNPELTILDNEAIYSKKQIEAILNEFLNKNRPSGYKVIHHGNSGNGAFFQIGELITSTDVFRTYFYAKNINGKFLIQEFRIEEN